MLCFHDFSGANACRQGSGMQRAYSKNPHLGICDFQNSANPRDKPASAKRYKDVVNLGELREHLYSNCTLSCDDLRVIVGGDIGKPSLRC